MIDKDPSYFTKKYRVSQKTLEHMFDIADTAWNNVYVNKTKLGWTPYIFWLNISDIDLNLSDRRFELIGDLSEHRIFIVEIETGCCKFLNSDTARGLIADAKQ